MASHNQDLESTLQSVLHEIDSEAEAGAHRSTTYLAASAIEGLFGELMGLLRVSSDTDRSPWPSYKRGGKPKCGQPCLPPEALWSGGEAAAPVELPCSEGVVHIPPDVCARSAARFWARTSHLLEFRFADDEMGAPVAQKRHRVAAVHHLRIIRRSQDRARQRGYYPADGDLIRASERRHIQRTGVSLAESVREARAEYARGGAVCGTVQDLMQELWNERLPSA